MKPKNITIDDLAGMVQQGFNESNTQFEEIRLELRAIRKEVSDVVHRREFDSLNERVKELEDMVRLIVERYDKRRARYNELMKQYSLLRYYCKASHLNQRQVAKRLRLKILQVDLPLGAWIKLA